MFTRKRMIITAMSALFFALVAWWLYDNLASSFMGFQREQRTQIVDAAMKSVPLDSSYILSWVSKISGKERGFKLVYFSGIPGLDEDFEIYGSGDLLNYYRSHEKDPLFEKAFESVSYEEIFRMDRRINLDGADRQILFVPYVDPDGYISGAGLFAFDISAQNSYTSLLIRMFSVAFILFILVLSVGQFSRDPFLGYAIFGLFAIVGVFVAYPLFEAVRLTFIKNGHFSLDVWKSILNTKRYIEAFRGSITLGCFTATFSTAVGFLFAFMLARTRIKGRRFFSTMATLPIISPPFSLTLSVILLFGNNGLITKQLLGLSGFNIYGLWGLTLVQTMGMFPIAFLTLAGVLEAIDSTLEDAALDLSAGKLKTFTSVTLPLTMPGILSAWLLVFTTSLADFANPLILSGSFRVLSVEAYMEVTGMNNLGSGAALSIMLLVPTLAAFLVQRFWVSRRSFVTVTGKPSGRLTELTSPPVKVFLTLVMVAIVLFLISLYGTIVAGCFVKNWGIDYSFSLENIVEAFQRGKEALIDTTILAGAAMPIAGILSMITALIVVRRSFPGKRLLEALIMTPFALPGTLVGISYILAFNKAPILLVGTGIIIVINYVVRELPVGVEGGVASLRQIDPSIEEAAQDLGADTPTVFRTIVLPLIRPAFISSLSYTFVRAMTAVSAVIFLISAKWYHMTVLIYNFSENLRFGLASVLATTLIIIVLVTFGLMRLLIRRNENLEKNLSL